MQDLTFEDKAIRVIEDDGQVWLGAADIARALEYNRADKVARIYDRHAAEFTDSMSRLLMVEDLDPQNGVAGQKRLHRVFSLRGAHLVAMFARTNKGQAFRRWVLDLIEQHSESRKQSLVETYYEAQADLNDQNRFASFCGSGLSKHRTVKPRLVEKRDAAWRELNPPLFLN